MFHEITDKQFLSDMRELCGRIVQNTCHILKEEYDIGSTPYLVGSGARNLILQNGNKPIDLDYNLEIIRCDDFDDGRHLKESARKAFNRALNQEGLHDCENSKSSLTSKQIVFCDGNQTPFSIDICIVIEDEGYTYRLINDKTGWADRDRYFWNQAPSSKNVRKKADYIKQHGKWQKVREQYLSLKNKYLTMNDPNHPSFICYVEAVNNVYNTRNHWK